MGAASATHRWSSHAYVMPVGLVMHVTVVNPFIGKAILVIDATVAGLAARVQTRSRTAIGILPRVQPVGVAPVSASIRLLTAARLAAAAGRVNIATRLYRFVTGTCHHAKMEAHASATVRGITRARVLRVGVVTMTAA
jgi:hypothetical protein